jgi:hypothetical protein
MSSNPINYDMVQINFGKSKQVISKGKFSAYKNGRAYQLDQVHHKCFAFLDLSKLNTKSANFRNAQIRSEQHSEEAVSEMQDSLKQEWSFDYPLPVVDEDGEILDGRTRTMAAIQNGEDFIPVEIVTKAPNQSVFIANAIKSNCTHKPSRSATRADYVNGWVRAWDYGKGNIGETEEDIYSWLLSAGIEQRWDPENPNQKQQHTKTVNEIAKKLKTLKNSNGTHGEYIVLKDEKSNECEKIVKNCLPIDINHCVLSFSYIGDVARDYFKHVVGHVKDTKEGKAVGRIGIVLKCTKEIEAIDYDSQLRKWMKAFDECHESCFMMADSTEEDKAYHLQRKRRPYYFIGVVPQVHGRKEHMDGKELSTTKIIEFDKNTIDSNSLFR